MKKRKLLGIIVFATFISISVLSISGCWFQQIKDLETKVDEKTSDINDLEGQIEELKNTLEKKDLSIEELDGQIKELKSTLEQKNLSIDELTTAKEGLENAKAGLELKLTATEVDLQAANATIEEKTSELGEVTQELEVTKGELVAAKAELETKKTQLEASAQEISTLTASVESLTANVESLTTEKNTLTAQIATLNSEKEELENTIAQLTQVKTNLETLNSQFKAKVEELEAENEKLKAENEKLKTVYVNPLQFDVNKLNGMAITKVTPDNGRFAARFGNDNINLVVIKIDGSIESAVALGTEENAQITEVPDESGDSPDDSEEPEAIYKYVSAEDNIISKVVDTIQCPYEVNDVEATGYYIVFSNTQKNGNGWNTFTYEDGTKVVTGPLIYVTPDGEERDVLGNAKVPVGTKIAIDRKSDWGSPYMVFDENGNAFFLVWTIEGKHALYRYQPIANRLDDITPTDFSGIIGNFEVSLDGKYVVFSEGTKVKATKISDKSVKTIYEADSRIVAYVEAGVAGEDGEGVGNLFSVSNISYMDKNHSFYFTTSSYGKAVNIDKAVHRWNYETGDMVTIDYDTDEKFNNGALWNLGIEQNPASGCGPLILTNEGIFVMKPIGWNNDLQAHTGSVLLKFVNADGQFIPCELPESCADMRFAPPRYNQKIKADELDPSTWYTPSFFSNGNGIALIGPTREDPDQDTIYYYGNGEFKNLLYGDPTQLKINKMSLSDTSILFNGVDDSGNKYLKSVNLVTGAIITKSINDTVLNMMAVKGSVMETGNQDVKANCSVTIVKQDDVKPTVSFNEDNTVLTITVPTGYNKYTWSCNGVVLGTTNTLTRDVSTWAKGYYPIKVSVMKGSLIYTAFLQVEIK
ncbi:MAG: hypothetical protein MJ188_09845 [Treponema sp.]|nr:hypothetical protein [Treponema sp.]